MQYLANGNPLKPVLKFSMPEHLRKQTPVAKFRKFVNDLHHQQAKIYNEKIILCKISNKMSLQFMQPQIQYYNTKIPHYTTSNKLVLVCVSAFCMKHSDPTWNEISGELQRLRTWRHIKQIRHKLKNQHTCTFKPPWRSSCDPSQIIGAKWCSASRHSKWCNFLCNMTYIGPLFKRKWYPQSYKNLHTAHLLQCNYNLSCLFVSRQDDQRKSNRPINFMPAFLPNENYNVDPVLNYL